MIDIKQSLYHAAQSGDVSKIKECLEMLDKAHPRPSKKSNIELDYRQQHPLHVSASFGHLIATKAITEWMRTHTPPDIFDDKVVMAVKWTSVHGRSDVLAYLIESGASFKKHPEQFNDAFNYRSEKGHIDIVKLLVEHGLNPNDPKSHAAEWAAQAGCLNIIQFFVTECDVSPQDILGYDDIEDNILEWCIKHIAAEEMCHNLENSLNTCNSIPLKSKI